MLLLFMAVALSCGMAVARAGTVLVARTNAQSCADAVALAFVSGGANGPQQVAAVCGAVIDAVSRRGDTVHVEVTTEGVRASSTAGR